MDTPPASAHPSRPPGSLDARWFQSAISERRLFTAENHEIALVRKLLAQAERHAARNSLPIGVPLALAFDLVVAAEYYGKVQHHDWLYCPSGNPPLLAYPFVNACPRCLAQGQFHFHPAKKPQSGTIGAATTKLLCLFLQELFLKQSRPLKIYMGKEPVDVIIHDNDSGTVLLAEVKAAPLLTLPLAIPIEEQMGTDADGLPVPRPHEPSNLNQLLGGALGVLLPVRDGAAWASQLVPLPPVTAPQREWAYHAISDTFGSDDLLFARYADFWQAAFHAYGKPAAKPAAPISPAYWFTNGSGQPSPRPPDWPARSGATGHESVSDGKSSVGLDRTDDIKKATYQVLKIGANAKPGSAPPHLVKTAIISNIHAARHHEEYLRDLQDIVWATTPDTHIRKAADLPPETPLHNLFDGLIALTHTHARDEWIARNFRF